MVSEERADLMAVSTLKDMTGCFLRVHNTQGHSDGPVLAMMAMTEATLLLDLRFDSSPSLPRPYHGG